jgi:murein DD-endopeptidase MepM/ murein hydrolase activator NlpD
MAAEIGIGRSKKPGFGATLFARLFNLVADKEYLVSLQWDARRGSHFFALSSKVKNRVLGGLAVLALGLLCLTAECATWGYRQISLQYRHKQNASLKRDLRTVLSEQGSVEAGLDSVDRVEERIRALYGMNGYDPAFRAFGVGGRRNDADSQAFEPAVSEEILSSTLKNRQLQGKIDFASSSFRQIEEFVRYRHNLWEHTPFVLPAKGQITSGFGLRMHPVLGEEKFHEGLDIANSRWTPIYATADGIVTTCNANGNFGNLVVIDHGNGYQTKYAHMTKIMVEKGQLVKRYGLVGYMGDSGRATGIHLHYEVHRDGAPQNPEKYILPSGILVD